MHDSGLVIYNNRSSAYRETLYSTPLLLIPLIDCDDLSTDDNGSIAKINSKGLRGHPCHVPLDKEKYCDTILFVTTAAFG